MKKRLSRRRDSGGPTPGILIGIALLVVLAILVLIRFAFPDTFFLLARPLWGAGTVATDALGSALPGSDAGTLSRQLSEERATAAALSAEVARLSVENSDLRRLIGDSTVHPQGIAAAVLARPPFSAYDTLVIGVGASEGVTVGATVSAAGGIPVGTVESVSAQSAQISLFSVPGRTLPAWAGNKHAPITLSGSGAGTFEASAPKGLPLTVGDAVYASGGGAPFARIVRIDENPSSPTKTLRIQSLVNANTLTLVLIAR